MKAQGLKQIRESRGWTQRQLAARVGCHIVYIIRIEHGQRPSYDLALQLASVLDVPTFQIMGVFS